MRPFIFDLKIILEQCRRFGVKVSTNPEKKGSVTMNGEPFDVVKVLEEVALDAPKDSKEN